jgi:hypothetical protein
MLSQEQIEFAQNWLQGAFEGHIKDELKYMFENDKEDLFYDLCEEDLFLDITIRVKGASSLGWSSLK